MFSFGWVRTHLKVVLVMLVDYFGGFLVGFMEKGTKSGQIMGPYAAA